MKNKPDRFEVLMSQPKRQKRPFFLCQTCIRAQSCSGKRNAIAKSDNYCSFYEDRNYNADYYGESNEE